MVDLFLSFDYDKNWSFLWMSKMYDPLVYFKLVIVLKLFSQFCMHLESIYEFATISSWSQLSLDVCVIKTIVERSQQSKNFESNDCKKLGWKSKISSSTPCQYYNKISSIPEQAKLCKASAVLRRNLFLE